MWRIFRANKATFSNSHSKQSIQKTKKNAKIIEGVEVQFPYKPYNIQMDYMVKVITCVLHSKNGLLESPTGTGKTLSLLCPLLAWLNSQIETNEECINGRFEKKMRIIYASRTHFQLSQAITEMKKTGYGDIKAVVLGSRDQYCLNSDVKGLNDFAAKMHACRAKTSNGNCSYYAHLDSQELFPNYTDNRIYCTENLVSLGKRHTFCPFYASKELAKSADIIFIPYKYLIDKRIRELQKIDLKNAVVVIDEAHNIERALEEAVSSRLSSEALLVCINCTETVYKELINRQDIGQTITALMSNILNVNDTLCNLREILGKLVVFKSKENIGIPNSVINGIFNDICFHTNVLEFDNVISYLVQHSLALSGLSYIIGCFEQVVRFLAILEEHNEHPEHYKVFAVKNENENISDTNTSLVPDISWTLNVMCLNPSVAMNSLMECGPCSVIMTSGTMSPLEGVESELNVHFAVTLRNKHIVSSSNLQAFIIDSGKYCVKNEPFNSRYDNRNNTNYQLALGEAILKFSRVIPGGIFVFFPSYNFMQSCVIHWKSCDANIWNSLVKVKNAFVECRNSSDFNEHFNAFKISIDEELKNGSIFFGVCRGKLAEGVDAHDQYCRAVIVAGLPYPSVQDHYVNYKKEYLRKSEKSGLLTPTSWYNREMIRAVNQAVGRIIRHKYDFGAIIVLDDRFSKRYLSPWISDHCTRMSIEESADSIRNFFNNITSKTSKT